MAALFQFNEAAFNKSVAIYKNAIPVICGVIEAYNRLGLQPFEPTDLDSIFADLNSFISPKLLALNMQESLVKESDYFKMFKCKIGDFKHYLADDGINLDFGKMSELFSFNHDQLC